MQIGGRISTLNDFTNQTRFNKSSEFLSSPMKDCVYEALCTSIIYKPIFSPSLVFKNFDFNEFAARNSKVSKIELIPPDCFNQSQFRQGCR